MKRLLASILVAATLVVKSAAAFVPVPLLLAPPVVTTATGIALSTWAAIAAGVGALLYSVGFFDTNGNEFIRVRVNPNAPADVPAGWTAATNPANDPTPPASGGLPTTFWHSTNGTNPAALYTSEQAACNAELNPPCGSGGHGCTVITSGACYGSTRCCIGFADSNNAQYGNIGITTVLGCATGYSNVNGTCTLTNAAAVRYPPNSRCGLKISGGVMTYDSRDPDCDGPPAGMLSTDGKTLTVTQGAQRVQVQINADNTVSVTQWTPTPSGNTQIDTVKTGDPASSGSSLVKSASQSTTTATGDQAFQQTPSPTSPNFPDDYARDASVQAGNVQLSQINTKLSDIKTQLTTDGVSPTDPSSRTQSDIEAIFFSGTFDALRGWTMPARSVVCPTWSFSIWGQSYTLNSHCGLIENQRATVSTICLLVFALLALFIVLGA